jgi:hypothetical protein
MRALFQGLLLEAHQASARSGPLQVKQCRAHRRGDSTRRVVLGALVDHVVARDDVVAREVTSMVAREVTSVTEDFTLRQCEARTI